MGDANAKWDDLRSELDGLGLKLKMHVEQAGSGSETAEQVGAAFKQLVQSLEGAAKDEAVRASLLNVGRKLADAVAASVNQVAEKVQGAGRDDDAE